MNEKVTYKQLRSAVVQVDNSADTSKTYDIAADVRLQGQNTVEAFESGTVAKDGAQVATFYCYGEAANISINFQGIESNKQCEVVEAINAFMEDVKAKAGSSTPGELPVGEPTETEIVTQQLALSRMMINTMSLTDEQALEVKDLYPRWEELVEEEQPEELPEGYLLTCGGVLYKVLQKHTPQQDWTPGTATASLYAIVSASATEEHAGTREDPIPYVQGMLIEKDKYYTEDGILYVGLMDAPNGYPNDLKDLPTLASPVTEEEG